MMLASYRASGYHHCGRAIGFTSLRRFNAEAADSHSRVHTLPQRTHETLGQSVCQNVADAHQKLPLKCSG